VKQAKGYAWEVRLSEKVNGQRKQRCLTFDGTEYTSEKSVRQAIELTVAQINVGTGGEKADAVFGAITALYRTDHLPDLEFSTQEANKYLLRKYIELEFERAPLREMRPLRIDT
jgi:hypothetical protein